GQHSDAAGSRPAVYTAAQGHPSCTSVTAQTPSTPDCDALIAARPSPNVSLLPVDFGVVNGVAFIRFNTKQVPLYDAPDGRQVDTLAAGYTYVNVLELRDGWAEVRTGRWVDTSTARLARPSTFTGVMIHGLDMPFAWVLWPHCAASVPGGVRSCDGDGQLQRYQLVNIYATVNVGGWNWHLIGPGVWTNQQNLSIVDPAAPAQFAGRWVAVNTYEQNLVAYDGGTPVMATLVSSGIENDEWNTWPGTYTVRLMIENGPMDGAAGEEDFYSLDQVPYHMYFNGLQALHGAYWHDSFGYTHSHGCVNLTVSDAKWLFENWVTVGMTVYVYDSE
ncbi:MAG TPA: L,D-transpeptidase family protein, partial [Aggregatilineaceae bacterium]|nr:L,D-transpeptidase family protein [Aggregatilineaceae bacterium]